MAVLARTSLAALSVVALIACGHFGFEELPVDEGSLLDGVDADLVDVVGQGEAGDGATCPDQDKDGVTTCAGDCDDGDPSVFPNNPEICGDAKDNGCNAQVDEGCMGLGTFVSDTVGADTNPGTKAKPVKTIAQGIANAKTIIGPSLSARHAVYVAQGRYAEKVTLIERISLLGGHQCDATTCTWARDSALHDTSIDNTDVEGVLVTDNVTKKTHLDGFRVRGFSGSVLVSACITINGGTPIVANNVVTPGVVTGGSGRTIGIAVRAPSNDPAGALIEGNTIGGGSAPKDWHGIVMDRPSASVIGHAVAQITKNTIRGGDAARTSGIFATASGGTTVVNGNTILGGGTSVAPAASSRWGIELSSTMAIDSNRINVDQANAGTCTSFSICGGIVTHSATAVITNNVVFGTASGRSTALHLTEVDVPGGLIIVNGNYLDGAGAAGASGTLSSAISMSTCPACGVVSLIGRIRNNVLVGGVNVARYGVYEEKTSNRSAHPDKFDSNDFFFPVAARQSDVAYHLWNGTTATPLRTEDAIVDQVPTTPKPTNILMNVDPMLDTTLHIPKGSPLIDNGSDSDAPAKDFEGHSRPPGKVDIGHDEVQ